MDDDVAMHGLGEVIAKRLAEWGVDDLPLERMLFGTDDADRLAEAADAWCRANLRRGD